MTLTSETLRSGDRDQTFALDAQEWVGIGHRPAFGRAVGKRMWTIRYERAATDRQDERD